MRNLVREWREWKVCLVVECEVRCVKRFGGGMKG